MMARSLGEHALVVAAGAFLGGLQTTPVKPAAGSTASRPISSSGKSSTFLSDLDGDGLPDFVVHDARGSSRSTVPLPLGESSTPSTSFVGSSHGSNANGTTARESVAADDTEGNRDSSLPASSADGRFVAFMSAASNLVADDRNTVNDIFLRDRSDGTIRRVSVSTSGGEGNLQSSDPDVTPDGRYVAFSSEASTLVSGDTNRNWDVFRHDTTTGETIRVSVSSNGIQGDAGSVHARMSADGRYIGFWSYASNLVSGDTNGRTDAFRHDCTTGETRRVSKSTDGGNPNGNSFLESITADGQVAVYMSEATNVGGGFDHYCIYVHDLAKDTTEMVSVPDGGGIPDGDCNWSAISADGRFVAFDSRSTNLVPGDRNGESDVFVRDRLEERTILASRTSAGASGYGKSLRPFLARNGTAVAFESDAFDLVSDDTNGRIDVFVYDLLADTVERASVRTDGGEADNDSTLSSISDDASTVFFGSLAGNLVDDDTNLVWDVFSRERSIIPASWSNYGDGWPGTLGVPTISLDADPVVGTFRTVLIGTSSTVDEIGIVLLGHASGSFPTTKDGTLLVDAIAGILLDISPGGASWTTEIPFDQQVVGLPVYVQWIQTDLGASKGVSFSDGIEAILGL